MPRLLLRLLLVLLSVFTMHGQKNRLFERAPRPVHDVGLVACNNCSDCASQEDVCRLGQMLQAEIVQCCDEILSNLCGPVIHVHQIDIPLLITQPGHYCIAEDLSYSGTAITVLDTHGVLIDFNNNTIEISGSEAAALDIRNAKNVQLYGGYIQGTAEGNFGIFVQDSERIYIHNLSMVSSTYGFRALNSFAVVIDQCIFNRNSIGLQFGRDAVFNPNVEVVYTSCGECVVQNSQITDFTIAGLQMFQIGNSYAQDLIMRGTTETAENLVVKKSVQVGIKNINIEGPGTQGILVESSQAFAIEGCQINLEQFDADGITINPGLRIFFDGGLGKVRLAQAKNYVINDCIVTGTFDNGIYVYGAQQGVVKNCEILGDGNLGLVIDQCLDARCENCTINLELGLTGIYVLNSSVFAVQNCMSTIAAPSDSANALELLNASAGVIKNCVFGLNAPESELPGGDGILLRGGVRSCVIQDCSIINFPEAGILSRNSDEYGPNIELVIDHCVIHKALEDGIRLEGVTGSVVKNCDISFADFDGMALVGCSAVEVLNNRLNNNGFYGLQLDADTVYCNVRDNSIFSNLLGGIFNNGDASNAIYHNFANGNGSGAIDNYTGVALVVAPAAGIGALENISQ